MTYAAIAGLIAQSVAVINRASVREDNRGRTSRQRNRDDAAVHTG